MEQGRRQHCDVQSGSRASMREVPAFSALTRGLNGVEFMNASDTFRAAWAHIRACVELRCSTTSQ
jgi:hypothetical protein